MQFVGADEGRFKPFDEVGIGNEAFVFGYPTIIGEKGQFDIGNTNQLETEKPLIRRGAVAGLNATNQTIILDASVYGGNSGGLVLEVDLVPGGTWEFYVIGMVMHFVPFNEIMKSLQYGAMSMSINVENSGYSVAIPTDRIREIL